MASSEHAAQPSAASEDTEGQPRNNAVELQNLETSTAAQSQPSAGSSSVPVNSESTAPATTHSTTSQVAAPSSTGAMASSGTALPPLATETAAGSAPAASHDDTDVPITPAPRVTRLDSIAIGPATDASAPNSALPAGSSSDNPVCTITLLLGNGARHPYKLDEKYLTKRNVDVPGVTETGKKDPFSISVYTLKELILREWREEWEPQPASPSSIRLIHFGRLLDDKAPLKECRFNPDTPNVVHMSIKPQEMIDDEEASKSKNLGRDGAGEERTAGCHCIIL